MFKRSRDDYYRYTSLFAFKHPRIQERFDMFLMRQKLCLNTLLGLYFCTMSLLPLIIQWRALIGEYGIFWTIYTITFICSLIVLTIRIVIESFYHSIEQLEMTQRLRYYNIKGYLNTTFLFLHSIVISLNLTLKTDRLCDINISVLDTQFCNVSNGMPMDTFVILLFLLILYQQLFPVKFIYTFMAQIIQFIAVLIVAFKTFSTSTWPLNIVSLSMFLGIAYIQFYLQANILDRFILEDSIQTLEINEASHQINRSRIENRSVIDDRSVYSPEQSCNSTIFYNTRRHDDETKLNNRPRAISDSTISSLDDSSSLLQ